MCVSSPPLANLAVAAENQVPMWQRDDVQAAIMGGAAVDQPEAVRVNALLALSNLTRNLGIQPSLVQAGVRDLLDDARAQHEGARRDCDDGKFDHDRLAGAAALRAARCVRARRAARVHVLRGIRVGGKRQREASCDVSERRDGNM